MNPKKYYHGTSSLFLDSIMEKGLGAINPNVDYGLLELLRYLFSEAEKYLIDNAEYNKIRLTTLAMAEQRSVQCTIGGVPSTLHFKHDCIYVAYSLFRAVVYAANNEFGSEILTRIISLYRLLKLNNENFQIPKSLNYFEIDKFDTVHQFPVLIETYEVNPDDLAKEDGKTAREALEYIDRIEQTISKEKFHEFTQYCNFQLLKPIRPEKLKYYRISYTGKVYDSNFSYTLQPIR